MNSKMKGLSCLLSFFALINSALACCPYEVIGGIGPAQLRANNISTLGVTSSETDTLVQTNNNTINSMVGQLGVGYTYYFGCHTRCCCNRVQWFPAIEPQLNLYQLESNSIDGDVYRFNNSNFNDLSFDIPVHSTRLMLDAALTVVTWREFSLYAIGGVGNAWNRVGYNDRDKGNSCPEQRLSLSPKTNSNWAWEAGAGVLIALNESNTAGLSFEYLYTHFGNVSTPGSGNTGTITAPTIASAHFNMRSQAALLALHVALG